LLDEALAEQRAANQAQVEKMLSASPPVTRDEKGWRLALSGAELESLLQVLNDIRVGNWCCWVARKRIGIELTEAFRAARVGDGDRRLLPGGVCCARSNTSHETSHRRSGWRA